MKIVEMLDTRIRDLNSKLKKCEDGAYGEKIDYSSTKATRDLNERLFTQLATAEWATKLEGES